MPKIDQSVSLPRFIMTAELLDHAFAGPEPLPDHLAHKCELAEQALGTLSAKFGSTSDMILAEMFALTHREE